MILQRIFTSLLAAVLLLTAGCDDSHAADDNGPDQPGDTSRYKAGFYVSTGDVATSRALPDGDYDGGSAAENYIDIAGQDYAIMFFDRSDRFLGRLTNISLQPVAGDTRLKTYRVTGDIDAAAMTAADGQLKIVMLANWRGSYPDVQYGITTIPEMCASAAASYTFDFDTDMNVGPSNPIPMFGVTNLLTGITFDESNGYYRDLGTLYLLRAYAKIQVVDENPDFAVASVTLTRAHSDGLMAPKGVTTQEDYLHASYDKDFLPAPTIPASARVEENIALQRDGNVWTAYVPEFRNITAGAPTRPLDTRARLALTFDSDFMDTRYIEFKYYGNPPDYAPSATRGDYFDIMRNNWYTFTVKSVDDTVDLDVEVDVQPFSSVVLEPSFGVERDQDTGWIVIRDHGIITNYYCDRYGQYYNANKEPIANRLERVNGLFIQPESNSRVMRYAYDPATNRYWLDTDRRVELTNPTQLKFEKTDKGDLILMVDRYGVAIYFYSPANDRYFNENNSTLTSDQVQLGLQRYLDDPNLVVTSLTFAGEYRYVCNVTTDEYYEVTEDDTLKPIEAYPPKQ